MSQATNTLQDDSYEASAETPAISFAATNWLIVFKRSIPLLLMTMIAAPWLAYSQGSRIGTVFILGSIIGGLLFSTSFGFTGAFRRMIVHRDVAGVQAMIPMLALGTLLFAPILAMGSVFGQGVTGAVAPAGTGVAVGAFMFGLGMQLAGACGSGTLVTTGGGSSRILVALLAFIAGSFWASLDMGWWLALPKFKSMALGTEIGWPAAVAVQLAVLAALWQALEWWRRPSGGRRLGRGTWLLLAGAIGLALMNWITLLVTGHPWSITWAFTLWGAKAAQLTGWDPTGVWFWTGGFTEQALNNSIFADETSVMDIGILLGAFAAAYTVGRINPGWRIGWLPLCAAIIGGLLMGYGARIAFGCNIGAFFSGVASTSLHGWLWIVTALLGMIIGVRLRPLFRLAN